MPNYMTVSALLRNENVVFNYSVPKKFFILSYSGDFYTNIVQRNIKAYQTGVECDPMWKADDNI